MTTVPTRPEAPPITLAKKFKLFATPEDLEFWNKNPTRLYRIRPASSPESYRSGAGRRCHTEEHWLILNRTGPNACTGRVIVVWMYDRDRQWNDPSQYLEGLPDEDLKSLIS